MANINKLVRHPFRNLEADVSVAANVVTVALEFSSDAAAQIYFERLRECVEAGKDIRLTFREPMIVEE
jgi:hypothetical protein